MTNLGRQSNAHGFALSLPEAHISPCSFLLLHTSCFYPPTIVLLSKYDCCLNFIPHIRPPSQLCPVSTSFLLPSPCTLLCMDDFWFLWNRSPLLFILVVDLCVFFEIWFKICIVPQVLIKYCSVACPPLRDHVGTAAARAIWQPRVCTFFMAPPTWIELEKPENVAPTWIELNSYSCDLTPSCTGKEVVVDCHGAQRLWL